MAVKLVDIAKAAGVSKATASRALSNPDRVSNKTRLVVEKAAKRLNYVSDGVARALSERRTRTIGAIVPTLENAIYAISMQGLERELAKYGYTLLIASHQFNLAQEIVALTSLISRGVDAIALVGLLHEPQAFTLIKNAGIPYVCRFDNKHAAEILVNHLLSLGHQRLGVISGILKGNDRARDRVLGIQNGLKRHGLKLDKSLLIEKPYGLSGGREGILSLLGRERPPTAVMCGNDILAIGALTEAIRRGVNVPNDLSITGFDDMEIAALITPSLTTIHLPMFELGVNVADFLLSELGEISRSLSSELQFELMVRASTGKAPRV
jgi:LacI family transcriptional regulator